jgi:plasmid stabilization system protein ParE
MTWHIQVEPVADQEIQEAIAYYETKSTQAAVRLAALIEQAFVVLAEHPQRYPIFFGDFRKYRVSPFPNALIYALDPGDQVSIAGFVNLMTNPKRWERRFGK